MLFNNVNIKHIVIITKENGKVILKNQYELHKFSFVTNTLHSTSEPAYQEYYYDDSCKFIWFYNGLHHRPFKPNVYKIDMSEVDNTYNHDDLIDLLNYDLFKESYWNSIYYFQFHLQGKKYNIYNEKNFNEFMKLSNKFNREAKLKEIFMLK